MPNFPCLTYFNRYHIWSIAKKIFFTIIFSVQLLKWSAGLPVQSPQSDFLFNIINCSAYLSISFCCLRTYHKILPHYRLYRLLFTFSTKHFTWSLSGFPFKIRANPQQMAGLRKYRQKKPKKKRSQKTLRDCMHARAAAFVLNPKTVISRAFIPWTATAANGEGSRGRHLRRRRRRRRCLLQLQLAQSEVL